MLGIRKNKPYREVKVGGFTFQFYYHEKDMSRVYLMIKSDNDSWSIKLNGGSHAYGYLLAANEQDKNEQLHGFATILYSLSMLLTTDQGLTDDIVRGINKYMKRKMKESERKAKSVTKEQIMADEALMQSVLDDSLYNSKGYREEFKRDVKDALNEIGSKYAAE